MKNFLKKNWLKLSIVAILAILVVVSVTNKNNTNVSYRTFTTKRGDLGVSVTGTGSIEASESRKVFSKVSSIYCFSSYIFIKGLDF